MRCRDGAGGARKSASARHRRYLRPGEAARRWIGGAWRRPFAYVHDRVAASADPAAVVRLRGRADFVVVDVETACSRVSSICQVGIVGFRDGREVFEYETLLDPCDEFHAGNIRVNLAAAALTLSDEAMAALDGIGLPGAQG